MNSRERVLSALNHNQPDRVPIDFSGHRSSGISAIAYAKLRKYLGLKPKTIRVYDMIQQLALVDDDVLDMFGVDVVELGRGFLLNESDWKDWILPDGTSCQIPYYINVEKRGDSWYLLSDDGKELGVQKPGCLYFDQIHWPYLSRDIKNDDFSNLPDALNYCMWGIAPTPGGHLSWSEEDLTKMKRCAKRLRNSTDRAIIGLFGGGMFESPQSLYRTDNYLIYMGLYPDATMRLLDKVFDIHMQNLDKWLNAVGSYIDVIVFGDDLGGQNGPLISPTMYRKYYKPYHQKLWNRAKKLANVKVNLHCCGGIYELIPDLIEAGLDAINPVQISCKNMDSVKLKSEFGKDLTFWGGGCETQNVLPHSTPKQVAEHVKRQVEIFSPDGGFVFQQVHNIMANVPPENITEMFHALKNELTK